MAPEATPVVRIRGLTKRLGRSVLAVDGLDLTVEEGQVVGLAGPNGAG
jgi:ABC-2 type transport system ATP-binding protein